MIDQLSNVVWASALKKESERVVEVKLTSSNSASGRASSVCWQRACHTNTQQPYNSGPLPTPSVGGIFPALHFL